jgi:hypothetical protein
VKRARSEKVGIKIELGALEVGNQAPWLHSESVEKN